MKLLELKLHNVFPFKDATFDFDWEGITAIRGLNKDAAPGVTNGAGKSALMSGLAELVLDESPSGKYEKKRSKKKKATASVRVALQRKHRYEITKRLAPSKSYEILRDGRTINSRTVSYGKEKIQQIFGLSETQFYTRLYLDGTVPHPLIVGSAAARQEFIVDLFNLGNIDNIRSLLNKELSSASKRVVQYSTLRGQLDGVKERLLPKEERRAMKREWESLKEKQTTLSARLNRAQRATELLAFERQNRELLERFHETSSIENISADITRLKTEIAELEAQREAVFHWSSYNRARKEFKKSYGVVKERLNETGVDQDTARKRGVEYETLTTEVTSLKRRLEQTRERLGKKPETVERPKESRERCLLRVEQLKHERSAHEKLRDGSCPTCGQPVKPRDRREIDEDITRWRRRVEAHERADEQESELREYRRRKEELSVLEEEMQEKARSQKKLSMFQGLHRLIDRLPERPEKPLSEEPVGFDERKLKKKQATLSMLRSARQVATTIQELSDMSDRDRERAEEAKKIVNEIQEINVRVSEILSRSVSQSETLSQAQKLKADIEEVKSARSDHKILKALVGAYSSTGLKKFMIQRYCSLLQAQINHYRRIFFDEEYLFEFKYDSKLEVLVHRQYGKKTETSDVRKLSGAEKRMFTLLLFVATVVLLPVKQRWNTVIMDEPESQLGSVYRQKFVEALPVLQKLVPHIVILTPRNYEIPGARYMTVVKNNGVATLVHERVRRTKKEAK
jgi:DNA repair exonuclease SbcCD ATPase subunit